VSLTVTHAREYSSYSSMKARCYSESNPGFKRYGARGIGICQRWRDSFAMFLADMGPRPEKHSIDRVDNSKGYDCGHCADCLSRSAAPNCRWATVAQQQSNRRIPPRKPEVVCERRRMQAIRASVDDPLRLETGERLRLVRETSGLKLRQLAKMFDIKPPSLSIIETCQGGPSLFLAFMIDKWSRDVARKFGRVEFIIRPIDWIKGKQFEQLRQLCPGMLNPPTLNEPSVLDKVAA